MFMVVLLGIAILICAFCTVRCGAWFVASIKKRQAYLSYLYGISTILCFLACVTYIQWFMNHKLIILARLMIAKN